MLTAQEQNELETCGFVRIEAAFEPAYANQMEERVWELLREKFGVLENQRSTWRLKYTSSLQELKGEALFERIGSERTESCIDSVLGEGRWVRPKNWGQFLVTFPTPGDWVVPSEVWHTDFGFGKPPAGPFGVLLFSFLSEVRERSGGTAVIAGSHRLVHRFVEQQPAEFLTKMKRVRRAFFESSPWLRELSAPTERAAEKRNERFMQREHQICDVPVRVAELVGSPGDIVLGHPWLMHTGAPNHGDRPRMMCVQRIDVKSGQGPSETQSS